MPIRSACGGVGASGGDIFGKMKAMAASGRGTPPGRRVWGPLGASKAPARGRSRGGCR
jgi:hypothetical protein